MIDNVTPFDRERRLSDVIRHVKVAAAEKEDAAADIREADRARLELLAEELRSVVEAVPDGEEWFDFALSTGSQPRFWIDAVAHVHMGRDQRTYRFVRDTRLGRVVVAETDQLAGVADAVSRYIAQRIVERERIVEGDVEGLSSVYARREAASRPRSSAAPRRDWREETATDHISAEPVRAPSRFAVGLIWFILGGVAGAALVQAVLEGRLSSMFSP